MKKLKISKDWTLFLDRDGVINERIWDGYVTGTHEFRFKEAVLPALKEFATLFNRIVVVTNQQGVAKGLMTEKDVREIHSFMCEEVERKGGRIDKCYFATNIKGTEPDLRKPSSVMAEMAKADFPEIDFRKSIMVGDTDTDIIFGTKIGMTTVRIVSEEPKLVEADLELNNLMELVNLLEYEN